MFAANDQMALGLVHALHDAGRRVPDDVSVVGFDDIPEIAHFLPPLTTVRPDGPVGPTAREIGAPELIVRRSSGPPPPR